MLSRITRAARLWTPLARPAPVETRTTPPDDTVIPASTPDDDVIELMEGITVASASVRQIRKLLGVLATATAVLVVQTAAARSGWTAAPIAPRTVLAARPPLAATPLDQLRRFEESRTRSADLIRLATVVAPATLTIRSFALTAEERPDGSRRALVRFTGLERHEGAVEACAGSVRALAPRAEVAVDAAAGAAGTRAFGITVAVPVRGGRS